MEDDLTEYGQGETADVSGTFELLNWAGSTDEQTVADRRRRNAGSRPVEWTWRSVPGEGGDPAGDMLIRSATATHVFARQNIRP
jgi:hypothetical protein